MPRLKITQVGNSLGVTLPRELLAKLRVGKGDHLTVTETPNGLELSPYDPEFERQFDVAETVMHDYRDALRKLAE